jgi:hypothetical protein
MLLAGCSTVPDRRDFTDRHLAVAPVAYEKAISP